MALQSTLTFSADGAQRVKAKNGRDGVQARYHVGVTGDFGGGTLTIGITYDGGVTVVTDISDSATTAFTDDFSRLFSIPSAENSPAELVLTLASATAPDLTAVIYNER